MLARRLPPIPQLLDHVAEVGPVVSTDPQRRLDLLPRRGIELVLVVCIGMTGLGIGVVVAKDWTVGVALSSSVIAVSPCSHDCPRRELPYLQVLQDIDEHAVLAAPATLDDMSFSLLQRRDTLFSTMSPSSDRSAMRLS